jgi:dephospho-CoA kinase
MIIIGLTGSIGMGKSTAARQLRRMGVPVHEADKAVHKLLTRGGAAVPFVAALFPQSLKRGAIDRRALASIVYQNSTALRRLEAIVHPLVHQATARWLRSQKKLGRKLVVLDIPLLFEVKREHTVDAIWVVSAPPAVQRARVLARPHMTPARFKAILRQQVSDTAKRRRADVVIPTLSHADSREHLQNALLHATKLSRKSYPAYWEKLL